MQVINIHKRKLQQPKAKVVELFKTIATKEDKIWPYQNWPAIRFKDTVKVGVKGGHGRIKYTIIQFTEGESIEFQFTKPDGFIGTHKLYLKELKRHQTEIVHEIKMNTSTIKATFLWVTVIRWLHDALIEDAFDRVENHFSKEKKVTKYSLWVKLLRAVYKRKSSQIKHN